MKIEFTGAKGGANPPPIQINCPFCGGFGTFKIVGQLFKTNANYDISIQCCPSDDCKGIVIAILKDNKLLKTYPGVGRPINTDNVPERIKSAFREGVDCFIPVGKWFAKNPYSPTI